MTNKIKHLDYIQQNIPRMATVSFRVKARISAWRSLF